MKKLLIIAALLALAATAMADGVTIGVLASTGADHIQLTASYPLYEWEKAELYGDLLWAVESKRVGWGLSVCSERTGIEPLDSLLDVLHVDGVGVGAYTNPDRELDCFIYAKFGVYEF